MKISKFVSEITMLLLCVIGIFSLNIPAFFVEVTTGETARITFKIWQLFQYSPFGMIVCLIPFLLLALYNSFIPRNTKTIMLFVLAIVGAFAFNHSFLAAYNGLYADFNCYVQIKAGVVLYPLIMLVGYIWLFLCSNVFKYKM